MRVEDPKSLDAVADAEESVKVEAPLEGRNTREEKDEQMFVFKIAVVGDYNVGKTSIVKRLLDIPYENISPLPQAENKQTRANGAEKGDDKSGNSANVSAEGANKYEAEVNSAQNGANTRTDCNDKADVALMTKNVLEPLPATTPTVGTDFFSRVVRSVRPGQHVRLQFWDTAGLERYASVHDSTFRRASALIVVFDVRNRESFAHVTSQHLKRAMQYNPDISGRHIFIVGNKVDLVDNSEPEDMDRFVTQSELQSGLFSAFPDVHYYETSAQTNYGVWEVLHGLCQSLPDNYAATTSGEAKEEKAAVTERDPLHSLLPLCYEPETTLDEGTVAEDPALTADGTLASLSSPSSIKSRDVRKDTKASEDELFSPRECADEDDVCHGGADAADNLKSARGRGSNGTVATVMADPIDGDGIDVDVDVDVEGEDEDVIADAAAEPECTVNSSKHVDPNKSSPVKEEGEEDAVAVHSERSAPGDGVVDKKVKCNGSDGEVETEDATDVECFPQEDNAAPPSVQNTARFGGNSLQARASSFANGGDGVLSCSRAARGKSGEDSKADENPQVTSHRKRIDDMLKRIDEDAGVEDFSEGGRRVEQMQEEASDQRKKEKSPVKLSRCFCFGSKGGGSKRSGC
ncbi:small GTP-binding rab protein, putative [Trypanosoma brucei brucei TREU927]|uniref:Small GTP-binding rab protein, putative n=1 Tax=Trypanosoma brucei brucei (strain 927/4 GUTat10.1) TaxID=185431 RepID=Q57WL6_TRYB2|nr:small GTP-binding rab protein, putative [Trypanosoma brucei brucei TREU927]AAX70003.1 small GTP-binding rab protein, putative [Trypanosoma brucei]AAZ13571.1 small GTP-binding rab protein, putative [Trypanosoma brucei brucei TREU927]